MMYYNNKKSFTPRKPVKTFRDLDVYQKPLECAVLVSKELLPQLIKYKYPFAERLMDCALSVPLLVAEAHSLRFADFALGVGYLEKAMSASNKMVVYLEHAQGLYGGSNFNSGLIDDISKRYLDSRTKMFHLEKSWKRFRSEYEDDKTGKGKQDFKY